MFDHAGKLMYQGQFKMDCIMEGAWYLNDPKHKVPDEKNMLENLKKEHKLEKGKNIFIMERKMILKKRRDSSKMEN